MECLRSGLTLAQTGKALLEYGLYAALVLLIPATLAALTDSLARFSTVTGCVIAAWFAIIMAVQYVTQRLHWLPTRRTVDDWEGVMLSALLLALAVVAAAAALAWLSQHSRRWRWAGTAVLGVTLVAVVPLGNLWSWNLFPRPELRQPGLALQALEPGDDLESRPGSEVLWSHFRVSGLKTNQIVFARQSQGEFKGADGQRLWLKEDNRQPFFALNPGQRAQCWRLVRHGYPPSVLWLGNPQFPNSHLPYTGNLRYGPQGQPPVGQWRGLLDLEIISLEQTADLPLRAGAASHTANGQVGIDHVAWVDQSVRISVSRQLPRLLLERDALANSSTRFGFNNLLCVLYHPAYGEAFPAEADYGRDFEEALSCQRQVRLDIIFPYPELRSRLTGITPAAWLAGARLQVYALRTDGVSRLGFDSPSYTFVPDPRHDRQTRSANGLARLATVQLPPNPGAADYATFVDTLLAQIPEPLGPADTTALQGQMARIGPAGLPAFVDRLPLLNPQRNLLEQPLLRQLARREHLPGLLRALDRSPDLAWLFQERGWVAEALTVLRPHLQARREPLPSAALVLLAQAHEPALYGDLHWQFVRLNHGHAEVLAALEKCPGFDTDRAVREAWQARRQRDDIAPGLVLPAARRGLPEALARAILNLNQWEPGFERKSQLAELQGLVNYTGPASELEGWLFRNLGRLQFNPDERRYHAAGISQ